MPTNPQATCPECLGRGVRSYIAIEGKCVSHERLVPCPEHACPTCTGSIPVERPEIVNITCECGHSWAVHQDNAEADYYCSVESCDCGAYSVPTPPQASGHAVRAHGVTDSAETDIRVSPCGCKLLECNHGPLAIWFLGAKTQLYRQVDEVLAAMKGEKEWDI